MLWFVYLQSLICVCHVQGKISDFPTKWSCFIAFRLKFRCHFNVGDLCLIFSAAHGVRMGSEAHPVSYPIDMGGSFPRRGAKHPGQECATYFWLRLELRMHGALLSFPHAFSWRGICIGLYVSAESVHDSNNLQKISHAALSVRVAS
jgi:hypothetical protein